MATLPTRNFSKTARLALVLSVFGGFTFRLGRHSCAQDLTVPAHSAALPGAPVSTTNDPLLAARCSLHLKKAPLGQTLAILGMANDLHFRFAVVPDTTVSLSLNDSLLVPAVEDLLHASGFDCIRHDRQIWVLNRPSSSSAIAMTAIDQPSRAGRIANRDGARVSANMPPQIWPATWQKWTRVVPPGKGWMSPLALKTPTSTAQRRAETMHSVAPASMPIEPPLPLFGWQTLSLDFAPDPLGVAVREDQSTSIAPASPQAMSQSSSPPPSRRIWLRWPFWLRQLPRGAQLRLHTEGQATLWINGARVLPRWSGTRLLEVDNLLQTGFNCLAFECEPAPSIPGSPAEPLLRYEWLFASS